MGKDEVVQVEEARKKEEMNVDGVELGKGKREEGAEKPG